MEFTSRGSAWIVKNRAEKSKRGKRKKGIIGKVNPNGPIRRDNLWLCKRKTNAVVLYWLFSLLYSLVTDD